MRFQLIAEIVFYEALSTWPGIVQLSFIWLLSLHSSNSSNCWFFLLYDIQSFLHNDDSLHSVSSADFVGMVIHGHHAKNSDENIM